jgi:septal ring factor EnvC (AmiA/AmiB activator)
MLHHANPGIVHAYSIYLGCWPYSSKQDKWDANIETVTKEAFAELRIKPLHQMSIQGRDCEIDRFKEELRQHENAIDNLRGYITFLESKISKLEHQLDEHYE